MRRRDCNIGRQVDIPAMDRDRARNCLRATYGDVRRVTNPAYGQRSLGTQHGKAGIQGEGRIEACTVGQQIHIAGVSEVVRPSVVKSVSDQGNMPRGVRSAVTTKVHRAGNKNAIVARARACNAGQADVSGARHQIDRNGTVDSDPCIFGSTAGTGGPSQTDVAIGRDQVVLAVFGIKVDTRAKR